MKASKSLLKVLPILVGRPRVVIRDGDRHIFWVAHAFHDTYDYYIVLDSPGKRVKTQIGLYGEIENEAAYTEIMQFMNEPVPQGATWKQARSIHEVPNANQLTELERYTIIMGPEFDAKPSEVQIAEYRDKWSFHETP